MYQVMNHIDEQGRMMRLPDYYINNKVEQVDSHGFSYKHTRDLLEQMGYIMGINNYESLDRVADNCICSFVYPNDNEFIIDLLYEDVK